MQNRRRVSGAFLAGLPERPGGRPWVSVHDQQQRSGHVAGAGSAEAGPRKGDSGLFWFELVGLVWFGLVWFELVGWLVGWFEQGLPKG